MRIVATFESYEDMEAFAQKIVSEKSKDGDREQMEASVPEQPAPPVQNTVPAAPVPTAPVQNTVPVAPAPVQTSAPMQAASAPVQQPLPPTQQVPVNIQAPVVPTTPQAYTLDELARAAMTLMDAGRQVDLQGLLRSFGVEALPALPKEQYGAFATALRGMGAQI